MLKFPHIGLRSRFIIVYVQRSTECEWEEEWVDVDDIWFIDMDSVGKQSYKQTNMKVKIYQYKTTLKQTHKTNQYTKHR